MRNEICFIPGAFRVSICTRAFSQKSSPPVSDKHNLPGAYKRRRRRGREGGRKEEEEKKEEKGRGRRGRKRGSRTGGEQEGVATCLYLVGRCMLHPPDRQSQRSAFYAAAAAGLCH